MIVYASKDVKKLKQLECDPEKKEKAKKVAEEETQPRLKWPPALGLK